MPQPQLFCSLRGYAFVVIIKLETNSNDGFQNWNSASRFYI